MIRLSTADTTKQLLAALFAALCLLTAHAGPYEAGQTCFGRSNYVEYIAGDLPLIISAPHGGYLKPEEIPNRTYGVKGIDTRTQELAREIHDALLRRTGRRPHIIINHLHRSKMDANREIVESAQGSVWAEHAWRDFQGFIEAAKESVTNQFGRGFYIDLHGHGHKIPRLELGYLLSTNQLNLPDEQLNAESFVRASSLRSLAEELRMPLSELLRGPRSFGAEMENRGYPSVPSPAAPHPGDAAFYSGGYNTARHGSRSGGAISGMQIETHYRGVRDTPESRRQFADALAEVLDVWFQRYYGMALKRETDLDQRPVVRSLSWSGPDQLTITWQAISNRTYVVQHLDPARNDWVDKHTIRATGDLLSLTNLPANSAGRFRLTEAAQSD